MDPRFFTPPHTADSFRQENKGLFSEQIDQKGPKPHGSMLKTEGQSESLQAEWCTRPSFLPCHLKTGRQSKEVKNTGSENYDPF